MGGELEARLDLQLGSAPQDRLHDSRGENFSQAPTQLQISSDPPTQLQISSDKTQLQISSDPPTQLQISSDQSENSAKTPVQLQNSSSSSSSEESSSLIFEERRKGRNGPRLPLPLPASTIQPPPYAEISKAPMCMDLPYDVPYEYENLPRDPIEEHIAQPGPDNPVQDKAPHNERDMEKIVDDATVMEKTNPGRGFEDPVKKSNLRSSDANGSQKCVAIAMGKIMHSPFPLMDKEEVEAVQRYLLADIGHISEIKISSLATEPEEDGLFLHQIQVKFTLDSSTYGTHPPTSLANHISQYEWLRRNQSIVRITDVHFKVTEEKSALTKLCRRKN